MTDQRSAPDAAPAQMPAGLRAILSDEVFVTSVYGLRHVKDIGSVRIEIYHVIGDEWDVLCSTRQNYSVAALDLLRAGALLNRIEHALAQSGGAGEGLER